MSEDQSPNLKRVRFSDGGTFEINVRSAGDYLLNGTFLHFYFVCVVIYAATLWNSSKLNLSTPASIIVWSSVLVSAFLVLLLGVRLNLFLVRARVLSHIITPLILVPVIVFSTFMGGYVVRIFEPSVLISFDLLFDIALRNFMLVACFDIFHGRYVAPLHPAYVAPRRTPKSVAPPPSPKPSDFGTFGPAASLSVERAVQTKAPEPKEAKPLEIGFGKEKFVVSDIQWIQSESHYLRLQMTEKSHLVRAKLKTAADTLGDHIGIQINRSVWVAFSAIEACTQDASGYLELRLKDQSTHRVTKARQLVFKTKFADFERQ